MLLNASVVIAFYLPDLFPQCLQLQANDTQGLMVTETSCRHKLRIMTSRTDSMLWNMNNNIGHRTPTYGIWLHWVSIVLAIIT